MSFRQKDYFERMAEQLAQMVATMAGRRGKEAPEVLVDDLQTGKENLFGMPVVVIDSLAPSSVREHIGSAQAIAAYVQMLELEASLLDDAGRANEAIKIRARINSLSS